MMVDSRVDSKVALIDGRLNGTLKDRFDRGFDGCFEGSLDWLQSWVNIVFCWRAMTGWFIGFIAGVQDLLKNKDTSCFMRPQK